MAAPGSGNSQARLNQGCQDTDNNLNDFAVQIFSARNTATPLFACSGGGTTLFAAMTANPATVIPGGSTLLAVTVIPATTPPSTGITVVGDLTQIGGSATQTFFDDGTNGDETAGDNVYSIFAPIPANATGGVKVVTATASDAQARTVPLTQNITVSAPLPDEDPLIFGNPSNATANVANETNYLMVKPQYSLSYHRSNGRPNWVAWRLDSSWIGGAPRQDDYRPDPALPAGWYQVQDNDYSGSGYDRGHMCPSGDRTRSIPDNSATFLMTNFVPQLAANNQGPWNDFENYCRTLASQGNETRLVVCSDHEEVGSASASGAQGPFLESVLMRLVPDATERTRALGASLLISAMPVELPFGLSPSRAAVAGKRSWITLRRPASKAKVWVASG